MRYYAQVRDSTHVAKALGESQGKKSFITLTQVFKAFAGQHGGRENTAGTNFINFLDIKFNLEKTLNLYVLAR
jgi:hypothetical protein